MTCASDKAPSAARTMPVQPIRSDLLRPRLPPSTWARTRVRISGDAAPHTPARRVDPGLVARAVALEPFQQVGIQPQGGQTLHRPMQPAAHGPGPIRHLRHVGGVDRAVRHRGNRIEGGLFLNRQFSSVLHLHMLSAPFGLPSER